MSDLKQRIVDASVELIREQGVRAISFREVARRAGVSHQAPYHHFKNHQGILRAIAEEGFAGLAAHMEAAAATHPDPLDQLTAAGFAYVEFGCTHVGHLRVMFDHALHSADDPELPLEESQLPYQVLRRLAHAAHAAGYGASMAPQALVEVCWCAVHGLATLRIEQVLPCEPLPPESNAPQDEVERVISALDRLLRQDRADSATG